MLVGWDWRREVTQIITGNVLYASQVYVFRLEDEHRVVPGRDGLRGPLESTGESAATGRYPWERASKSNQ